MNPKKRDLKRFYERKNSAILKDRKIKADTVDNAVDNAFDKTVTELEKIYIKTYADKFYGDQQQWYSTMKSKHYYRESVDPINQPFTQPIANNLKSYTTEVKNGKEVLVRTFDDGSKEYVGENVNAQLPDVLPSPPKLPRPNRNRVAELAENEREDFHCAIDSMKRDSLRDSLNKKRSYNETSYDDPYPAYPGTISQKFINVNLRPWTEISTSKDEITDSVINVNFDDDNEEEFDAYAVED